MLLQACKHALTANPAARSGARLFSSAASKAEVCFLDPKVALAPDQPAGSVEELVSAGDANVLHLPHAFVPELPKAHHEMGDFDDPMNGWCWGRRGEIFEYTLLGGHSTKSGYSGVILKQELEKLLRERTGNAQAQRWKQILESVQSEDAIGPEKAHPFLFVGRIVESARATVYALHKGKEVDGLLVSSASADDE